MEQRDRSRRRVVSRITRRGVRLLVGQGIGRDFTKLWSASAVSLAGDGIALTAAPLYAYSLTSNPRLVAGVTTALTLPYLLFSLPAGVITDRVNGRRAMAAVDGFRAVLVAGFTLLVVLRKVALPDIYACFFVIGTCDAFFRNTSQTIVPQVAEREVLAVANGRMMSAEIVMNEFVGPMSGGFLFAAAAALPFGIDAASFAASSALLTRLRTRTERERAVPATQKRGPRPALRPRLSAIPGELAVGLRALWQLRLLRSLALIAGLNNFVSYGALAILVVFARHDLHMSKGGYGLLLGSAAAGGLVASRVGPWVARTLGADRAILLAMTAQGASYAVIFWTSQPILAGAMLAVASAATVQWNLVAVVLRQTQVPSEVLGRVTSVYRLIAWGALPVGSVCGGLIAGALGARWVFAAGAILLAAIVGYLIVLVLRYDISGSMRPTLEPSKSPSLPDDDAEVLR